MYKIYVNRYHAKNRPPHTRTFLNQQVPKCSGMNFGPNKLNMTKKIYRMRRKI